MCNYLICKLYLFLLSFEYLIIKYMTSSAFHVVVEVAMTPSLLSHLVSLLLYLCSCHSLWYVIPGRSGWPRARTPSGKDWPGHVAARRFSLWC